MPEKALAAFDFAIISDDLFIGAYLEKAKVLEKLNRYEEALVKYQSNSLYLMDIHTGLGKRGQAYILSEAQKSSAQYQDNHRFFKHCNLVHTANDVSISSQLRGTLSSRLPEPDKAITLEYGTRGGLSVLCALALENYHYWHNRGEHIRQRQPDHPAQKVRPIRQRTPGPSGKANPDHPAKPVRAIWQSPRNLIILLSGSTNGWH